MSEDIRLETDKERKNAVFAKFFLWEELEEGDFDYYDGGWEEAMNLYKEFHLEVERKFSLRRVVPELPDLRKFNHIMEEVNLSLWNADRPRLLDAICVGIDWYNANQRYYTILKDYSGLHDSGIKKNPDFTRTK